MTAAATGGLEMEARKEGGRREEGYVERRRRRGEGPLCLHFVWDEEQDEGCVKDTEMERCCVFLFVFVSVCLLPINIYRNINTNILICTYDTPE